MRLKDDDEKKFWMKVYVASIQFGMNNIEAKDRADKAVDDYRETRSE